MFTLRKNKFFFPILGYIVVVVVVFGRALFPGQGELLFGDDVHRMHYFVHQFFYDAIRDGEIPWWNPYLFSGVPGVANPQFSFWYPLWWALSMFPVNIVISLYLAFHVFWAMMGMYVLGKYLGIQSVHNQDQHFAIGPWIGGILFGLSGFFMARIWGGHVDIIAAASWMPWIFWAIAKGHLRASMFLALQLLAGYQTIAMLTMIAVSIYTLLTSVQKKSIKPLFFLAVITVLGIGLVAFYMLPVLEFTNLSTRSYGLTYAWHSAGAIEWRSLLQLLNPFQFGNQYTYNGPPPNFVEHSMFVGITGFILALLGIFFVKTTVRIVLLGIVLFGLLVSLGPNGFIDVQYLLWKLVPMYHYLRIPARHVLLMTFGLATLAGLTLSVLRVSKFVKVCIALIVVGEMVWFGRGLVELKPKPDIYHDVELVERVKQDEQPVRLLQNFGVWVGTRDALDFNSVINYEIFSATGYDPSMYRPYYEFVAKNTGTTGEQAMLTSDVQVSYVNPGQAELIDRLNIKYLLVPPAYDPFSGNPRYKLIWDDGKRDYRLYENSTVLPRFYLDNRACGTAQVTGYKRNSVTLSVDSTCDTTLLSSEVYYPGWSATVDGKKVAIDSANGVFRSIFVPGGKHEITYTFFPRLFIVGLFITVLTGIGLLYVKKHMAMFV